MDETARQTSSPADLSACPLCRILRHHNGTGQARVTQRVTADVGHWPIGHWPSLFPSNPMQTRVIARVFCEAPGRPVSWPPPNRGRAGRQGPRRTHGPRHLAISRLIEAASRKSAKSDGVPRAVFDVCSASPPVVLPFRQPRLSFRIGRPPNHRFRPRSGPTTCDRSPAPAIAGAQWRAAGAPGRLRLRPPGPRIASPMQGHSPATAPRPVSEMLDQTPLGI